MDVTHVTQTLSAVAATPEQASVLDVQEGAPLLSLIRRSYNKEGDQEHLRDFLEVVYHPDHFQYKMDLKID